ncbi:DUF4176 domain-containing protein [Lactococcus allomyrinae]|uniref:DUF4176 domain-containing protein n=1 Tax=Lactococcus allomyrinae TaxID=2419773 RepID=A0A387BGE1_9LACT|nr:DUF4176 domain-containing protein [Lactococcus allomyrinae]AYG00469.1 DUF4176 domain-containing protein [Lactococcus allomyrinae]
MAKDEVSLLPLGTILKLKNDEISRIIVARAIKKDNSGIILDRYKVAPHPEGDTPNTEVFSIEADQIEKVIFKGYSDEADEKFLNQLIKMMDKTPAKVSAEEQVEQSSVVLEKQVAPEASGSAVSSTASQINQQSLLDDDPFYKFRG